MFVTTTDDLTRILIMKNCGAQTKSFGRNEATNIRDLTGIHGMSLIAILTSAFIANAVSSQTQAAEATSTADPSADTSSPDQKPTIDLPKKKNHTLSVSGDYFRASGDLGVVQRAALSAQTPQPVTAGTFSRDATYYGGTLSYSYGQAYFLDLSYNTGNSDGNSRSAVQVPAGDNTFDFRLRETFYQAYVRYVFPGQRARNPRLLPYVRAGASLIESSLDGHTPELNNTSYKQESEIQDILGNVGAGITYAFVTKPRLRLGVQLEAEGFYGHRSQDQTEHVIINGNDNVFSTPFGSSLFGGIARSTLQFEYRFGRTGLFRFFTDGGIQFKYTVVNYDVVSDDSQRSQKEPLWGPYARAGFRYSF